MWAMGVTGPDVGCAGALVAPQAERERCAATRGFADGERPADRFGEALADVKTEPDSTDGACVRLIQLIEAIEDQLARLRRDARPFVIDGETDPRFVVARR